MSDEHLRRTLRDYPRVATNRPCRRCGRPVQPGQLWLPAKSEHVACSRPRRVRKLTRAGDGI